MIQKKIFIIICPGFSFDKANLQPWRYFLEFAKAFHKIDNAKTYIVTNIKPKDSNNFRLNNLKIIHSKNISIHNQFKLYQEIKALKGDKIFWNITKTSIFYFFTLKKFRKIYAVVTSPTYSYLEIIRAIKRDVRIKSMSSIIFQKIIPNILFKIFLNKVLFDAIILQSIKNLNFFKSLKLKNQNLKLIKNGINIQDKKYSIKTLKSSKISNKKNFIKFLYMGSPRKIRGFELMLKSFSESSKKTDQIFLKILARRDKVLEKNKIRDLINYYKLSNFVEYTPANLSNDEIREELIKTDVVLLPFILAPSDVPLAVLEAMAYGKLIITSEIDGITELIKGRGILLKKIDSEEMKEKILNITRNRDMIEDLGKKSLKFISEYPTWEDIHNQIINELSY